MKKVIIIDDEPLARSIIKEYLKDFSSLQLMEECDDGFQGMKAITKHKPDLIFLDIQMPKITGFEMLELIDTPPPVIFTTAFDEYAVKAFELNSIDYLLKPFSKERFDQAINKWKKNTTSEINHEKLNQLSEHVQQPTEENRIVVKSGNEIRILAPKDVLCIEAYDDYVKIFTRDDVYLKKKTMAYYEDKLDHSLFMRVHRSFIINLEQLLKIEPLEKNTYQATLKNAAKIPVSRSGYLKLKEQLGI